MPRKTRFVVGQFAFSKVHLQLVRVLSREGDAVMVTRAVVPDNRPLRGPVEDTDLLTLKQFETWAKQQSVVQMSPSSSPDEEPEPPMPIVITRTLFAPEMMTPDEKPKPRALLHKGQKFLVHPEYKGELGLDWLCPIEGGYIALPSDAWDVDTSDEE